MTVQCLRRVLTVTLVVCGTAAVASLRVQAQDVLPVEGGMITLVGCFQPSGAGHNTKYVLARPTIGSVASVTDGTCSADLDETAVELKDTGGSRHLGVAMLNHVIEVTGRLEKLEGTTDARDLRELHVRSFRPVPVVIPTPAAPPPEIRYLPAPVPQAAIPPIPEQPVATSGTAPAPALPKTASTMPLIGLLSLLSLSGALSLHLVGRRRRE